MNIKEPNQRILLICFDNIGDLIFCSALMAPLREKHPHAQIDLWCKQYTEKVGVRFPFITDLFSSDLPWDKSPGQSKGDWGRFIKTLLLIRKNTYDAVIVCSPHWTSALTSWVLKSKTRIGFTSTRGRYFLTDNCASIDRSKPVCYELCRLLVPLGIPAQKSPAQITRMDASAEEMPVAIIHPFAGNPNRCVPISLWLELATKLTSQGWKVEILGTEKDFLRIEGELSSHNNLTRHYDIFPDRASVFFGHDSGPTHIASALNIPIFAAYFNAAKPKENLPQGISTTHIYRTDGRNYDDFLAVGLGFAQKHRNTKT